MSGHGSHLLYWSTLTSVIVLVLPILFTIAWRSTATILASSPSFWFSLWCHNRGSTDVRSKVKIQIELQIDIVLLTPASCWGPGTNFRGQRKDRQPWWHLRVIQIWTWNEYSQNSLLLCSGQFLMIHLLPGKISWIIEVLHIVDIVPSRRLNSSSTCISLKALRALQPCSLAMR